MIKKLCLYINYIYFYTSFKNKPIMNSYQVRSTNPLYNDVIAYITAESITRANELAEENDLDILHDLEIILERNNVVDQLGKPLFESIFIY